MDKFFKEDSEAGAEVPAQQGGQLEVQRVIRQFQQLDIDEAGRAEQFKSHCSNLMSAGGEFGSETLGKACTNYANEMAEQGEQPTCRLYIYVSNLGASADKIGWFGDVGEGTASDREGWVLNTNGLFFHTPNIVAGVETIQTDEHGNHRFFDRDGNETFIEEDTIDLSGLDDYEDDGGEGDPEPEPELIQPNY